MIFTLSSVSVYGDSNVIVKKYSDVPEDFWAYSAIMNLTKNGLMSGTFIDSNGIATFKPERVMSRAEFIIVVVRFLYNKELSEMPVVTGLWYQNGLNVAIKHGLVEKEDFGDLDSDALNQSMSREEMALVLSRALEETGEIVNKKVLESAIPDIEEIGDHYKDGVRIAYGMGLIAGTNSKGTFNPQGVLTRAQAATVLNRLIDIKSRSVINKDLLEKNF